jgi:hypothetical protein
MPRNEQIRRGHKKSYPLQQTHSPHSQMPPVPIISTATALRYESNLLAFPPNRRITRLSSCPPTTSKPHVHKPTRRTARHNDARAAPTPTKRKNATAVMPPLLEVFPAPSQPTISNHIIPPLLSLTAMSPSPPFVPITTLPPTHPPATVDELDRLRFRITQLERVILMQCDKIDGHRGRIHELLKLLPSGTEEDPITVG